MHGDGSHVMRMAVAVAHGDGGEGAETAAQKDGATMDAAEASSAEAPCLCKHKECGHAITHSLN